MAGKTLWNMDKESDKVDWDLAANDLGLGQTCLSRVTRTWIRTQMSLAKLG
jgi:hypothetical protein